MSRSYRRKKDSGPGGFVVFLVIIAALVLGPHKQWIPYAAGGFAVLVGLFFILFALKTYKKIQLRHRLATLEEIDIMDGIEFEQYVANLLKKHGFIKVSLTEKYDMGVDIIAEKDGLRWGIQTKRYSGLVKAAAVRQVIAGLNSYKCDEPMVITNSTFSKYAIKLAQSNHCILIDRMELAKLISDRV